MGKNLPANAEYTRDMGSTPGSGRYPGGGNGNPIQYSWTAFCPCPSPIPSLFLSTLQVFTCLSFELFVPFSS